MHGPLLMACEDMGELHLVQFIVELQHNTARIAEHDIDALFLQAFQDSLGTIHPQTKNLLKANTSIQKIQR